MIRMLIKVPGASKTPESSDALSTTVGNPFCKRWVPQSSMVCASGKLAPRLQGPRFPPALGRGPLFPAQRREQLVLGVVLAQASGLDPGSGRQAADFKISTPLLPTTLDMTQPRN